MLETSGPFGGDFFGGDCGVARVDLSTDGGKSRRLTQLGADQGTYGFRQWQTQFTLPAHGMQTLMVRCSNAKNETQPDFRTWNPAGYRSILLKRPMWLRSKGGNQECCVLFYRWSLF